MQERYRGRKRERERNKEKRKERNQRMDESKGRKLKSQRGKEMKKEWAEKKGRAGMDGGKKNRAHGTTLEGFLWLSSET